MTTALKHGVNFFDNAEVYAAGKSETAMGHIFHKWFKEGVSCIHTRTVLHMPSSCARPVQALGHRRFDQAVLGRDDGWHAIALDVCPCMSQRWHAGVKGSPNATGLSRKHILEGIDASLERLQLTYVDLLFCHRPGWYP